MTTTTRGEAARVASRRYALAAKRRDSGALTYVPFLAFREKRDLMVYRD